MKKGNMPKLILGIICILLLLAVIIVAVLLDDRGTKPVLDGSQPETTLSSAQEGTQQTQPAEQQTQPEADGTQPTAGENTTPDEDEKQPSQESVKPTAGENTTPDEDEKQPSQESVQPTAGENTAPDEDEKQPSQESVKPTVGENTTPDEGEKQPSQESVKPTVPSEEQPSVPEVLPPSVVIPPEKDPETGEEIGISFPCQIPGYALVVEKLAPYSGMFVEDGSNVNIENVAMLLVYNKGDAPVEYTQICVVHEQQELLFDISALPAGQKLVVQEKTGKTITEGKSISASALIVQGADMEMSENMVKVTDNGDNTLTVENLTDATIPTVRIFYKYYMENEDLFVGGIAFTVRISRLSAGAEVTIQPSHYTSQTSRVVMVLTYDSEV